MNKTFGMLAKSSALVLSITLLPGCKFFKKEEKKEIAASTAQAGTGPVLAKINGKAVIFESDFLTNINQMLQANPYFRGAGADSLPMAIKRKFFDELLKQELILADAEKKNISQDPEFIKARNEMMMLVDRSLKIQWYEKKIFDGIKVSESDFNKYCEENKERLIKEQGGILVLGARFDTEKQANSFFEKVKNNTGDFEKLAKEDKNARFKKFERLSKEAKGFDAGVPAPIKEAAFAMQDLPRVEKVKVGDATWVIAGIDKTEPVLYEPNEIRPQVEGMIKQNVFKKQLDDELKTLRSGVTIDVNEEYFKEPEQKQEKAPEGTPAAAAKNDAGANVAASA